MNRLIQTSLGLSILLLWSAWPGAAMENRGARVGVINSLAVVAEEGQGAIGGILDPILCQVRPGRGILRVNGLIAHESTIESLASALKYLHYTASRTYPQLRRGITGLDITITYEDLFTPRAGASAGAALAAVIFSAVTNTPILQEVALTGTIRQDGSVGRIAGVGFKVAAVVEAGGRTVLVPEGNAGDLREVPETILRRARVVLIRNLDQVLFEVFGTKGPYGARFATLKAAYEQAIGLVRGQQYAAAARAFRQLSQGLPNDLSVQSWIAYVDRLAALGSQQQLERARAMFEDGQYETVLLALGENTDPASQDLLRMARERMQSAQNLYQQGQAAYTARHYEEAAQTLQRALEWYPHYEAATKLLTECVGILREAQGYYEQARAAARGGDHPAAVAAARKAVELYPGYTAAQDLLTASLRAAEARAQKPEPAPVSTNLREPVVVVRGAVLLIDGRAAVAASLAGAAVKDLQVQGVPGVQPTPKKPFSFTLNTADLPESSYEVHVVAHLQDGREVQSPPVRLSLIDAQTVRIVTPAAGERVDQPRKVKLEIADFFQPEEVTLCVDGLPMVVTNTFPPRLSLDPAYLSPGEHTLHLTARDGQGRECTSAAVKIVVGRD